MNGLRLEARLARRGLHELGGVRQIEVNQFSAIVADGMVVAIGFTVVAAGAISEIDFVNEPGFLQVAQRVVNGCVANAGQAQAGRFKDVAGSRVIVAFLDHLKDRLSLGS